MGVYALKSITRDKTVMSNVQSSVFARGVGGVLGNKGSVFVRMDVHDTSICFINSHFTAHQKQVKKRNDDYFATLHHPAFDLDGARMVADTKASFSKLNQCTSCCIN